MTNNLYLAAFKNGGNRDYLARRFSWAIPDERCIEILVDLQPIVEIGAGTGYWAWLLEEANADVVAYDSHPTILGHNRFHYDYPSWFDVQKGGAEMAAKFPRRTLFLCWPPLGERMGYDALQYYQGNQVVHVGAPGLTADHDFHRLLMEDYECVEQHTPPQWPGINDVLTVWRRKALKIVLQK